MFYPRISNVAIAINSSQQFELKGSKIDKFYAFIIQNDHAESISVAETDLITINLTLKKNGVETMVLQGVRLEDLIKYTNSKGGVANIPGTNCSTFLGTYIDLGDIDLKGADELSGSISFGALGTLTGGAPKLYLGFIRTHDLKTPIKKYTSYNCSGNVTFPDALELFSAGVSGAGQAGNTIYIAPEGDSEEGVLDTLAWAAEMMTGKYENDETLTTFLMLYIDPEGHGKQVAIRTVANTELLVVQVA